MSELDPVSPAFKGTSALYYYNEGKFRESLDECLKAIEISPNFSKIFLLCFFDYLKLGEDSKAAEVLQQSMLREASAKNIANDLKEIFSKS